jgi:trk system potassium uptake protein TrkA
VTTERNINVVVAGAGSVGRFVAEQLTTSGHSVTIIENDRSILAEHRGEGTMANVHWILGDACDVDVLTSAGLETATVIAAVTGDDEDNLVISLLAKQEFGVPRVLARVNNPKNEWMFGELWGVDVSVSTPHLLAGLVQDAVGVDTLVRLLPFEGGRVRIVEIVLASGSTAAGAEISSLGIPRDCSVVAIQRDGHVIVPRGDTILHTADKIVLLVTEDSEPTIAKLLAPA